MGDVYFYLKVSPDNSLKRKRKLNADKRYWGDTKFLNAMNEFYDMYFDQLRYSAIFRSFKL